MDNHHPPCTDDNHLSGGDGWIYLGHDMNINSDGAEIDAARDMEVYGDWIKFVDGEGATVKIVPRVIRELYEFAMAHAEEFDEGAWE